MSFGKRFVGRQGWGIRIWEAGMYGSPIHEWTNLHMSPVRSDIVIEHNSVGAVVGGSFTLDGFWPWMPRSKVIEIFVGTDFHPSKRVGLGILVIPKGKKVHQSRMTEIEFLGLHSRDENGLSNRGFSQIGPFVTREMYILGSYLGASTIPTRFGLVIDGAMKELFGDRVDSSWGVRPDKLRVAGFPGATGTIMVPVNVEPGTTYEGGVRWGGRVYEDTNITLDSLEIDTRALNVSYEDSGFEEPAFITEAEWRIGEKYSTNTYVRQDNGLIPRRGSSGETGTGDLQTSQESLSQKKEKVDVQVDGLTVGVNIPSLVNNSMKNPNAFNAMYDTISVVMEATVTAKFDMTEKDRYEIPGGGIVETPAVQYVNLEWGEWLGDTPGTILIQDRTAELPSLTVPDPIDGHAQSVASSVPVTNSDGVVTGLTPILIRPDIQVAPKPDNYENKQATIPIDQAFKPISHQYGSLTPDKPKFVWRFQVPDALLQVVDGLAPKITYERDKEVKTIVNGVEEIKIVKETVTSAAYQWCIGVAASANRKSTKIKITFEEVIHSFNAVHPPGMPDFPGINLPYCSPPTFSGKIEGELIYGPIIFRNLESLTGGTYNMPGGNTRMVISKNSVRTEFQTSAVQRASNGTSNNVSNDRSFGYRQP